MPQTVPNRPTKGAVEPTVARKAMPSCSRPCTLPTARSIDIVIQVCLSMASTIVPSWCSLALMPCSAMKCIAVPLLSALTPAWTLLAFQKVSASFTALLIMERCSKTLVKMMYQLPIDMMTRITSVPLAT